MNREVFKHNLLKTLNEISEQLKINLDKGFKFSIIPVKEIGKRLSSTDDVMRLWLLSEKNVNDRLFDLDAVVELFSGLEPLYPIWVIVLLKETREDVYIFELQTSLRFRKPSQLANQDTEHPPFKASLSS